METEKQRKNITKEKPKSESESENKRIEERLEKKRSAKAILEIMNEFKKD